MARRWDDESDDELLDGALGIVVACWAIEHSLQRVKKQALKLMRRRKERSETASAVTGLPCAAEFAWTGPEDGPQPAEAVDSSQMIPPEVLDRADRGGE